MTIIEKTVKENRKCSNLIFPICLCRLIVEHSREYAEKSEADTILKLLKAIVSRFEE
jgi:hypothetical protein